MWSRDVGVHMLVGLRLFKSHWQQLRATLEVRADNITALTMIVNMKASGVGVNIIAREMALDVAEMCYAPDIVMHIPGKSNKAAKLWLPHKQRHGVVLGGRFAESLEAQDPTWTETPLVWVYPSGDSFV